MSGQEISKIPLGELEGLPAVRIQVPKNADPEYLVREFTKKWRAGVRVLWLEAEEWEGSVIEECLAQFESESRTHQVTIWSARSVSETSWPFTPLWYAMDCSAFLTGDARPEELEKSLSKAPYVPRPTEIYVVDPNEGSLSPAALDQIHANYFPESSAWLYFSPTMGQRVRKRALLASATSSYSWGIRSKHEETR